MKKKNCKDPICPMNRHPSRHRPTSNNKSKDGTTTSRKRSRTTSCRNKMCQASRSTVESSTSMSRTRTRSRESIKSGRSRSICCRSRKKRVCHCRRIREARKQASPPRKKKRIRSRCKTLKKNQTPLCICVKGSSSQDLRKNCKCPSTCPMLSKYDDCCCIRKRRNRSKKGNNPKNNPRNNPKNNPKANPNSNPGRGRSARQCRCKSPTSNPKRNIFARGLSNLRRKLQQFELPFRRYEKLICNGNNRTSMAINISVSNLDIIGNKHAEHAPTDATREFLQRTEVKMRQRGGK
ncbi:uncharacterized protein LOC122569086 [Bombus pyrosoma]|uniref:uncharacterized protein LOC122569086 n=1 Tax=Bombus pyrosoma TaxID=396416 RepID=UPI001CB8B08A|nr:uncharacterized protein LOC122569086 [Bombus pyrosoma]